MQYQSTMFLLKKMFAIQTLAESIQSAGNQEIRLLVNVLMDIQEMHMVLDVSQNVQLMQIVRYPNLALIIIALILASMFVDITLGKILILK
jgi:hypothetical protein